MPAPPEHVEARREPGQPVDLLAQRVERGGIRGEHAVAQRLEIALQVGERRPQLVRGVDDELAADHLLLREAVRHRVVRGREVAQLLGALLGHPDVEVAVGEAPGGVGDPLDRAREPAGEEHRDGERQERGEHRGEPEHERHALVEHRVGVVGAVPGRHHQRRERRRADLEDADPDDDQGGRHDGERGNEEADPDPVPGAARLVHQPARRSTGLAAR